MRKTATRRSLAASMFAFLVLGHPALGSTASFKPVQTYTVGTNPAAVAAGDFNSDGKPDLAVVNAGDPTINDPGGISILLGNGDGTFQSAINFSDGNNPGQIASGDFDGDGNDDLVVVRRGIPSGSDKGDVTIFLSNGDGTFRKGPRISTFNHPAGVVIADLDSDGIVDAAVSDETSIRIFLGKGDGTFHAASTYLPATDKLGGNSPAQPIVFDFNHDGKKDLGFTVGVPLNMPHTLEVLLGNGDGTFQAASIINTFSLFESPRFSADFNYDGNVDVIVQAFNTFNPPPGESLFLSNGDGTFSDPPGTNVLTPGADIVGDFDGDGNRDLAGPATNGQPALTIFTGKGDGSFQQPVTFSVNTTSSVEIALAADLNNDKAPDVVITNGLAGTNMISVMLNSGTDFSLSASPLSPSSIGAGQSASSTLSLQLLNLFDNQVSLTCSVQPQQAGAPTCSLSSNSVTFDASGKATATLTIAGSSALASGRSSRVRPSNVLWLPIAGFAFLGTGLGVGLSRKRKVLLLLTGVALFSVLISQIACGGAGSGGPKSMNYAITITGTSGQALHSATVNVTVR